MNRLASPAQLRASLIRWALFVVPTIVLLGMLSGYVAGGGQGDPWYAALDKPALYPPPATFGIVWSVLYVLIGLALAMVCSAWGSRWRGPAIIAFVLQFALNLAWSPVFFGEHEMTAGLVIILAMIVGAVVTTVLFARVRKAAAWLMVPYLVWITFAAGLNWQFLQLNPEADGAESSNAVQRIAI